MEAARQLCWMILLIRWKNMHRVPIPNRFETADKNQIDRPKATLFLHGFMRSKRRAGKIR